MRKNAIDARAEVVREYRKNLKPHIWEMDFCILVLIAGMSLCVAFINKENTGIFELPKGSVIPLVVGAVVLMLINHLIPVFLHRGIKKEDEK